MGIVKNFGQNGLWEKKPVVFLKDPSAGYLPINLSQFRNFLQKSTFLTGGGGLNPSPI